MSNKEQGSFRPLISENPAVKEVVRMAELAASSDINILLTGESGTGKNMVARAIHETSLRQSGPFIPVNCLAIPDTLIESELFGHEKGAFTDARSLKKGSFETANGGTLYLDEIGDMSLIAQGKILQAIEEFCYRRVGGEELIVFNARLISATNRDLAKRIEQGRFREDLYYRLKEVSLRLPPLRERKEDIPLLITHFVWHFGEMHGKPDLKISKAAVEYLTQYSWPGNVRELENVVKSAVVLCEEKTLFLEHFPFELTSKTGHQTPPEEDLTVNGALKRHIAQVLESTRWNKRKAASILRISRPRLDRYIGKFGIGTLPAARLSSRDVPS